MSKEKVFRVISQIMNVPISDINEQSSVENVEKWDSLQHINLILALEEEFGVNFKEDEIVQMIDANKIIEILSRKQKT